MSPSSCAVVHVAVAAAAACNCQGSEKTIIKFTKKKYEKRVPSAKGYRYNVTKNKNRKKQQQTNEINEPGKKFSRKPQMECSLPDFPLKRQYDNKIYINIVRLLFTNFTVGFYILITK